MAVFFGFLKKRKGLYVKEVNPSYAEKKGYSDFRNLLWIFYGYQEPFARKLAEIEGLPIFVERFMIVEGKGLPELEELAMLHLGEVLLVDKRSKTILESYPIDITPAQQTLLGVF